MVTEIKLALHVLWYWECIGSLIWHQYCVRISSADQWVFTCLLNAITGTFEEVRTPYNYLSMTGQTH